MTEETKMKRCRQCGEIKQDIEFRPYYGNRATEKRGRYKICKTCEAINARHKYLLRKPSVSDAEQQEINKIEELYEALREEGLQPPAKRKPSTDIQDAVSDLLERSKERKERVKEVDAALDTPVELLDWLNHDLSSFDPDQLEEISDKLIIKYKPQIGVDDNYKPVFDEAHRDALNAVLKRFDEYSDSYEW